MSRRLQVAIVCNATMGGSAVIATELAAGLAQRGHGVHLLAAAAPLRRMPGNIAFHRIETPEYPVFSHPPYSLSVASALVELHDRVGLDVIHVHYAVPHAEAAFLARQMLGASAPALLASLHGTDVTHVGRLPAYQAPTRFCVAAADAIVVPSGHLGELARQWLTGLSAPPVQVLPNFVDTDRFAPPERRDPGRLRTTLQRHGVTLGEGPVLVHVSTLRPIKRPLDLVAVMRTLRRSRAVQMVVVGDGPESSALQQEIATSGLGGVMHLVGQRDDFADWLGDCDVFVLPSESESFGVAALEALSSGVPVVGYRVGGLPEVVTAEVGTLVEPFDVDAMVREIDVLLNDEPGRSRRAAAARQHAITRFGRDAAIDRYERCLDAVVASRPSSPQRGRHA